jgi:Family of unknown function (DUF5889)/Protein of unknown function (DUF723)
MEKNYLIKKLPKDYDYSLLPNDIKCKSYVDIICPRHGVINMRLDVLLGGGKCRKCTNEEKSNKSKIEEMFRKKYGFEYEYDISEYKNNKSKIKIICKKHGEFYTTPESHINGKICKFCKSEKYNISDTEIEKRTKKFISTYELIYGDKYDYSRVSYRRSDEKIELICKKHGNFFIRASHHIEGKGCKKCSYESVSEKNKQTIDDFINVSKRIHGNFYDYSLVNYINNKIKVKIICPTHGCFEQTPHSHKMGYGCPECNITIGERKVSVALQNLQIRYDFQKTFDDCVYDQKLKFDFYLPDYSICIEFDGIQHFESIEYFGGVDEFTKRKERDIVKNKYCEKNNIHLLRIPYYENNIEKCISNFLFK